MYKVVLTAKASDNTIGRLSIDVEYFDDLYKVMHTMRDTVVMQNGEILSIYIKQFNRE